MKQNIIKKYKWYLFGAISIMLILSIGLSFCTWDSNSIGKVGMTSGVADYKLYTLLEDRDNNKLTSVGDIVTFGNYYQSSTDNTKSAIRWIVVDEENKFLTLLAESALTFGSFFGRHYVDNIKDDWVTEGNELINYTNYNESTVMQWLNSSYLPRYDGGTAFSSNASKIGLRGFFSEAFNANEQKYIVSKNISGIKGYAKEANADGTKDIVTYNSASHKVWLPSWSELFGNAPAQVREDFDWEGLTVEDGKPNKRFAYYNDVVPNVPVSQNPANKKLIAKCTPFASTVAKSNYAVAGDTSSYRNAQSVNAGDVREVFWLLRSPIANTLCVFAIDADGIPINSFTVHANRAIRPAICIPM